MSEEDKFAKELFSEFGWAKHLWNSKPEQYKEGFRDLAKYIRKLVIEARIDATRRMIPSDAPNWNHPNGDELAKQWNQRGHLIISDLQLELKEIPNDSPK